MQRRQFLSLVGLGGVALGGAAVGSVAEAKASHATTQAAREDGMYAAGPQGAQQVLWSVPTTDRIAALTFDDGPTPAFTADVLDILAAAAVPATFFMIGRQAASYPSLAAKVAEAGHELVNHTWSHTSAPTLTDAQNIEEIDRGTDAVSAATGATLRWYRPPRGMLTGSSLRRAHERQQGVAMWSVTRGPGSIGDTDADGVRRHLVEAIHPGAIVDLHDGVGASAFGGLGGYSPPLVRRREAELQALPAVLDAWKAAGYTLVTLSRLAAF